MFLSTVWGWKFGPSGQLDVHIPTCVTYLIPLHIHIEHFCPGFQGFLRRTVSGLTPLHNLPISIYDFDTLSILPALFRHV